MSDIDTKLLPEPPLLVLPSLATRVGLNEAIVLQQVHFKSRHAADGWWRAGLRGGSTGTGCAGIKYRRMRCATSSAALSGQRRAATWFRQFAIASGRAPR